MLPGWGYDRGSPASWGYGAPPTGAALIARIVKGYAFAASAKLAQVFTRTKGSR